MTPCGGLEQIVLVVSPGNAWSCLIRARSALRSPPGGPPVARDTRPSRPCREAVGSRPAAMSRRSPRPTRDRVMKMRGHAFRSGKDPGLRRSVPRRLRRRRLRSQRLLPHSSLHPFRCWPLDPPPVRPPMTSVARPGGGERIAYPKARSALPHAGTALISSVLGYVTGAIGLCAISATREIFLRPEARWKPGAR